MIKKRMIVTGANSGKGKSTTKELSMLGHEVIMACYSLEKAESAKEEILRFNPKADLKISIVNLDEPGSIIQFSDRIVKDTDGIDVLINNAGIYREERNLNTVGIEKVFMVNVLGPVLLSFLIFDSLIKKAPSRIVNLSSIGEKYGYVDIDNLNGDKGYDGNLIYNQSKRAGLMISYKMAELFKEFNVSVNSLHPGTLKADRLNDEYKVTGLDRFVEFIMKPFTKKNDPGVETTIFLADSDEVEGVTGRYFCNKAVSDSSKESHNKELQEVLFNYTLDKIRRYIPETTLNKLSI